MRRTRFISTRPLQMKIVLLVTLSMIIPLVLLGGCLYYLIFNIMAEQLGIPEVIAFHLFPVIHKINLLLLIGIPPIFFLLIIWGVFLSHQFVGPLDRLEAEIDSMARNKDYSKRLTVRKDDDVKGVIHAVNRLLNRIQNKE